MSSRKLVSVAGMVALLRLVSPAVATIQGDGFVVGTGKYTTGVLDGQNPPVPGFTSPWNQAGGATNVQVVSTGLTSSAVSYETGGAVNLVGPTTSGVSTLARNFSAASSSTYYMSCLCNRGNVNTINPGSYSLMGFGNTGTPALGSSGANFMGVYIGYSEVGATSSGGTLDDFGDLVLRTRQLIGGSNIGVDTVLVDGQATTTFSKTYLVIIKLAVNASGTDLMSYWVNPTDLTSETQMSNTALISGSVTTNNISSSADLSRLEFAESNFDGPVTFDEPRIATTLPDLLAATPVPEPTTCMMFFATAGLLACCGRRHRAFGKH
jgi:hypothetical protein